LLGGLTGSILSVIMGSPDPSLSVGSVGASGAVFAIFGAEMIYLYRHREIMGARGQAQFRNLLFLLGLNFFIGIASGLDGARVRIDNWAHLGGLIGGLILTWFIGPVFRVMQDPQNPSQFFADDLNPAERKYWLVSVYLIVLVGVLGVVTFLVRQ
ncbi:MAG: rhomboid family intramembrane serine protease, partial [Anaerolineae bacterium]|nr:rhomboid family intramembrane serine protease [Anaerolineae bacterium]